MSVGVGWVRYLSDGSTRETNMSCHSLAWINRRLTEWQRRRWLRRREKSLMIGERNMHAIQRITIIVNHLKATKLRDVSLVKIPPRCVTCMIVDLRQTHMFVRVLRANCVGNGSACIVFMSSAYSSEMTDNHCPDQPGPWTGLYVFCVQMDL